MQPRCLTRPRLRERHSTPCVEAPSLDACGPGGRIVRHWAVILGGVPDGRGSDNRGSDNRGWNNCGWNNCGWDNRSGRSLFTIGRLPAAQPLATGPAPADWAPPRRTGRIVASAAGATDCRGAARLSNRAGQRGPLRGPRPSHRLDHACELARVAAERDDHRHDEYDPDQGGDGRGGQRSVWSADRAVLARRAWNWTRAAGWRTRPRLCGSLWLPVVGRWRVRCGVG
jgi:hypothetical protein